MSGLNTYIEELLLSYDCVIIPELGGFVANYNPAYIDEKLNVFNPPSKKIIFNKNLSNNDGLLADHIAQKENISYEKGMEIINDFVKVSLYKLNTGERIQLENVGILYLDSEKNIQFMPKQDQNFLIDAFGLDSVYIEKLQTLSVAPKVREIKVIPLMEEVPEEIIEDDKIISIAPRKRIRYKHIAVAASFGLVALIPLNNNILKGEFQWAKMNPFYTSVEGKFDAQSKFEHIEFSDTESSTFKLEDWVKEEFGVNPKAKSTVIVEIEKNFHVIGGCFGKERYAKKFLKRLLNKGFDASIVDKHKGLHRVAFGSYETKNMADKAMNKITAETGKSAWVLNK